MDVIPAIDLRDGKVVRLIQGQYDRQINYHDDPAAQARDFASQGARWLHVVDLDGAKVGQPVNTETIAEIVAVGGLKVEVGGGLRDEASIRYLLELGVERVIIGTKAIQDPEWFSRIARMFPGRVVLGLDARGTGIATHGWLQESGLSLLDFAGRVAHLPIAAIIYTDISRDGMLSGPNVESTKALAEAVPVAVIASGGVAKVEDIRRLAAEKVIAGAIVGRSLYEGTLTVRQAIDAAEEAYR